jgi:O-antigen/teichoic acid export membrane protein
VRYEDAIASASGPHTQEPDLAGRVARGASSAALAIVLGQAISLITNIVVARLAHPTVFGMYASAGILLGISTLFTESGMSTAIVQRRDQVDAAAATALVANIVGGLGLALVGVATAPLVGLYFGSGQIGLAAAALAGMHVLTAAHIVPGALLQRRVSALRVWVEPAGAVAYGVVAVVLLSAGMRLWGLVIATYAYAAARLVLTWTLARWRPRFALVSWAMWRELARYGRYMVASELLREGGQVGTIALIGRLLGQSTLGQFRYAYQLVVRATGPIISASAYALLPAFSRIADDEARLRQAVLRALAVASAMTFPISLLFLGLGHPIAIVVLGSAWAAAGPIMTSLAFVGTMAVLVSVAAESFKASGRPDVLVPIHALSALLPVAFVAILLPLGGVGAGLALSISAIMVAGFAVRRLTAVTAIELGDVVTAVRPPLVCALAMAASLYALDRFLINAAARGPVAGFGFLLGEIVLGLTAYGVVLRVLAPRSAGEVKSAVMLVLQRRKKRPPN